MAVFRRYVFAFLAVCVALAVGIALGNGPLQGKQAPDASVSLARANRHLSDSLRGLRQAEAFDRAVSVAGVPGLLKGVLQNTSIALFVLPGVPDREVGDVSSAIERAGGVVVTTATAGSALVDPRKKTYVDSVATSSLRGIDDLGDLSGASPYERIGTLIGRAYADSGNVLSVDSEARRIDDQVQGARLLHLAGALQRRAGLVVVLSPGDHGTDDLTAATHQIEADLLTALSSRTQGLVVVGPAGAARAGGLLPALGHTGALTDNLSTVDIVGTPGALVTAVYALKAAAAGDAAAYGIVRGAVVMPPGLRAGGH